MKKLLLTVFLLLTCVNLCFADIPVYCPKCKTHLYNYKKVVMDNEFLLAEDFIPVSNNIQQPVEASRFVCPLCDASLNGWEYYGEVNKSKSHTLVFPAVSVLTKDENGNWKWVPYDVPVEIE
jgi:hypothetical protein